MSGSGGQIRQRPNGTWEGRYWAAGKRRSVYAPTKRLAQEKLRGALTNEGNGVRPVTQRVTVAAYLAEWIETSVAPRCRPRTVESYEETVRRYIVPEIGRLVLAKLEPADVSRMLAHLGEQTPRRRLSATTVKYAHTVLRSALARAVKTGRVHRNVATLVDVPSKVRHEMHPLEGDQVRHLLAATKDDPNGALYALAIATGMRQGELLALRWQDVDLEAGTLAVRHTLRRGSRQLAEPKTERARRILRLGQTALTILRDHRREQLAARLAAGRRWTDLDLVFATRTGDALDSHNVTRAFQAALRRHGLPRQRFHDLRHAYATLMIEAGEELAVVSRTLGHADLSTTADVYAHLTSAMLERSAARMDAILGPRQAAG
jgi:integrase